VKCIDVPFIHHQSDDVSVAWSIDWQGIEEAYSSGIKIHLLCSPHNPIGRVFSREELSKFLALAVKYDVTIISDEIHSPLEYSEHPFVPMLSLGKDAESHCVVVTEAGISQDLNAQLLSLVAMGCTKDLTHFRPLFTSAHHSLVLSQPPLHSTSAYLG
jgi:bifunctional pyridoxal-dependent enzyme with beta-cystathionase and maltose regulon repressor activities